MSDWFQIENSTFTIQITTSGAELKRMFAKPWNRELLWVPRDESDKKIWNRTSPILFPIVGKLIDDSYNFKEKIYQMPQHGFARDKNFKCLECGTNDVEFFLEADQETFKHYPFCFELRVKYSLEENLLKIDYSVKNVDRQVIFFSIGAHPAFETTHFENYEIQFEKKEKGFYQLTNGLVNWDQRNSLESNILLPSRELFSKDALIFKELKSSYVDLVDRKRRETIRLHGTNSPYLGIWAKENLPFICLEPWHGVSDNAGHNQNLETKKGIQTLEVGDTFCFSFSIELMMTVGL